MTTTNTMNSFVKHFFPPGKNTVPYRRDISSAYNARSARYSAQVTTIKTKPRQEMAATVTHTSHLLSEQRGHKVFDSNLTLATFHYRLGRCIAKQIDKQNYSPSCKKKPAALKHKKKKHTDK
jgi:hypothetical protein